MEKIKEIEEIVECYIITGDADFLIKIICQDIPTYEKLLVQDLVADRRDRAPENIDDTLIGERQQGACHTSMNKSLGLDSVEEPKDNTAGQFGFSGLPCCFDLCLSLAL